MTKQKTIYFLEWLPPRATPSATHLDNECGAGLLGSTPPPSLTLPYPCSLQALLGGRPVWRARLPPSGAFRLATAVGCTPIDVLVCKHLLALNFRSFTVVFVAALERIRMIRTGASRTNQNAGFMNINEPSRSLLRFGNSPPEAD